MVNSSKRRRVRSETIRSPALFLKEITVTEAVESRSRRALSGTRLKAVLFPFLHWVLRHTSAEVAMIPLRILVWVMRMLYRWPGNPLRLSCEAICRISKRHQPKRVYQQFLSNALGVMENYFYLYRYGVERVSERITFSAQDGLLIGDLVKTHSGVILAVPHNLSSAFSSLRLNQVFNLVAVAKNSPTIARTRITLDFFERMKVPILMVRGGNPFELARTLFSALKTGKVIAATLDNIDNADNCTVVKMFGQQVGLAAWAARVADRAQVPLVPCYFKSRGNRTHVVIGEPIMTSDVASAVQHYARFFEHHILDDPASWAYLADKRWRKILTHPRTSIARSPYVARRR